MSLEDHLYPFLRLYETAPQPLRTAAGAVYRRLPAAWRFGRGFHRFRHLARDSEAWDEERIRQHQVAAIRASLLAALEAPWYAERFREAGVDPRAFTSLDQLAEYPRLTKQDLIEHRERLVNRRLGRRHRLYMTSGGSTGIPVGFYLHKGVSRTKEQAYLEVQFERHGLRSGDRVAVIRGGVTSSRADGPISYFDAARNRLILSSYHLTPERIPEYVSAIRRFRPRHIHAYPSSALLLAGGIEAGGLELGVRLTSVLCGSEGLPRASQAYLERVFGAPVGHWYGHSERVLLAGQGRGSKHFYVAPTYGYAELGPPDAEGLCELIGTSFDNYVMPLIRYHTGDLVRVARTREKELAGLELEEVVGRSHEFIVGRSGRRISLTAINFHDEIFDGLLAVQFVQDTPGVLQLSLKPGPSWTMRRVETIRTGLLRKLGDDFSLEIRTVERLQPTGTGKHRWLVSSLPQSTLPRP